MRRLLVLSNSIADTFKWRTSLGLSNDDIIHCSPYQNPKRYRGLDELNVALVELDEDLKLSSELIGILETYTVLLGMKRFDGRDYNGILTWLHGSADWRVLLEQRRAYHEWSRSG